MSSQCSAFFCFDLLYADSILLHESSTSELSYEGCNTGHATLLFLVVLHSPALTVRFAMPSALQH